MTSTDKTNLMEGLKKLAQDILDFAALLEEKPPTKTYTYEETRAILAEKSRTGFRAEVKALLTAHGVKQLSDITDPTILTAIVAEAEGIGNA